MAIQIKRGTPTEWAATGVVLKRGQLGHIEDPTGNTGGVIVVGDGQSPVTDLTPIAAEVNLSADNLTLVITGVIADPTLATNIAVAAATAAATAVTGQNIPAKVAAAVTGQNIPAQISAAVTASIPATVTSVLADPSLSTSIANTTSASASAAVATAFSNGTAVRAAATAAVAQSLTGMPTYGVGRGHSMMAGTGAGASPVPTVLAALTGWTWVNVGHGGELSSDIVAHGRGAPLLALSQTGQIPASGPVFLKLTRASDGAASTTFIAISPKQVNPVTIAGVVGTLTWTGTEPGYPYTFTRTAAGSAVPLTRPTPALLFSQDAYYDGLPVIWAGRNNNADLAQVVADIDVMVAAIPYPIKRYIVLTDTNAGLTKTGTGIREGIGTTNYTAIVALEKALIQAHGRRAVNIRRYLIDYGLADAGLTATAEDLADIAADVVPTSLRSDNLHLNAAGYTIVATQAYLRMVELKYFDGAPAPVWTDTTLAGMTGALAYSDGVAATNSPTYSVTAGALPTGLTLNAVTGAITGTPTAGSYAFTLAASNIGGAVLQPFTVTVAAPGAVPVFTDSTLAGFTQSVPYSDGVTASGSATYSITAGALPAGITLNAATGAITGTPTAAAAYTFTITATNVNGTATASFSGTVVYSLGVTAGLLHRYSADTITVADGAQVASWPDLVGTDPIIGTAAATAGTASGHRYVKSAALGALLASLTPTKPVTVVLMLKNNSGTVNVGLIQAGGYNLNHATDGRMALSGTGISAMTGSLPANWNVVEMVLQASAASMKVNGSTPASNTITGPGAFSGPLKSSSSVDAWFTEIAIYDGILSDADQATIRTNVVAHYTPLVA